MGLAPYNYRAEGQVLWYIVLVHWLSLALWYYVLSSVYWYLVLTLLCERELWYLFWNWYCDLVIAFGYSASKYVDLGM